MLSFLKKENKNLSSLIWIDEFIANVKDYIYVRPEDCMLIKRPNEVQKLNKTAVEILSPLLKGSSILELGKKWTPGQQHDVLLFFHALKVQLEGHFDHLVNHPAVEIEHFAMESFSYPVLSELAITYKCNLKCNFCYAGINSACSVHHSKTEMSLEEMKIVIDKIFYQAKAPSISFTGGEPTLSPHLLPLIKHAKGLGMRVNLITNGTLITRSFAKNLKEVGLSSSQISLESTIPHLHNQITGNDKAFQLAMEGYFHLSQAGIHVHTNTTLSQSNHLNALDFPRFVKEVLKGKRFSMNLLIPTGTAKTNKNLAIRYSDIGVLLEQIKEQAKQNDIEFMWYSPVPMCLYNTIAHQLGNKGCSACDGLISVACNGDVLPCSSFSTPVGNLLKQDFSNIWDSLSSIHIRQKKMAPSQCQQCDQLALCHGSCPLYWEQMGTSELNNGPHCHRDRDSLRGSL